MNAAGWRTIFAVSTEALALGAAYPLGRALRASSPIGRHVLDSFAAGVSIAFVSVDLLVELTGSARHHVHAAIPIGTEPEGSLFAIVLVGLAFAYVARAWVAQHATRGGYGLRVFPSGVYRVLVGAGLVLESEHGLGSLVVYGLAMLSHLGVVEQHLIEQFPAHHSGLRAAMLAATPVLGAAAWSLLDLPEAALYVPLALVAGITIVQVFEDNLPNAATVRIGSFLVGVVSYSALIAARWYG